MPLACAQFSSVSVRLHLWHCRITVHKAQGMGSKGRSEGKQEKGIAGRQQGTAAATHPKTAFVERLAFHRDEGVHRKHPFAAHRTHICNKTTQRDTQTHTTHNCSTIHSARHKVQQGREKWEETLQTCRKPWRGRRDALLFTPAAERLHTHRRTLSHPKTPPKRAPKPPECGDAAAWGTAPVQRRVVTGSVRAPATESGATDPTGD